MMNEFYSFLNEQSELLEKAREIEIKLSNDEISRVSPKALCTRGLALINMCISRYYIGLGGKPVVELVLDSSISSEGIPANDLKSGDIVRIEEQMSASARKSQKAGAHARGNTGVIIKSTARRLAVALEVEKSHGNLDSCNRLWVVKVANDVPYKRMISTINHLKDTKFDDLSNIIKATFGLSKFLPHVNVGALEFFDGYLNNSQKEAVTFALETQDLALIHGPPGTGKTQTLIEIIRQFVSRNLKVLVCGPSNISVDNIADRLSEFRIPIIRIGHPARLLPTVLSNSLDIAIKHSEGGMLVRDIRKEMDEKLNSVKKTRNSRERRSLWEDIHELKKECKLRERRCTEEIIRTSKVVLSTLHGTGGYNVANQHFDVIIIDEAGQALEAQSLIALVQGAPKCILAGDHLQLPPTVPRTSGTSKIHCLETSLFERLINLHGPTIKRTLLVQYRMHKKIMEYPSRSMYKSRLVADESVGNHRLCDLPDVTETDDTREPLVFWDTHPQGSFREDQSELDESKRNSMEAALCQHHLRNLFRAGVKPKAISIITPYNAQVALVSELIKSEFPVQFPDMEIGSVDGFQGREKEAIILSLVRSNDQKTVGFLADRRRLNVAMTRPRRHFCVIGDSETVGSGNEFLKEWMEYLEENADLRYPDPILLQL